MNEQYRGRTADEIEFIASYLKSARALPLKAPVAAVPLSTILARAFHELSIDIGLFKRVCSQTERNLTARAPSFHLLNADRFMVGVVPEESDDLGGFHSTYQMGFQYISHYGFALTLNKNHISNISLRTLELARSYIHDSIHDATFRTFRKTPDRFIGSCLPVYREQYGINFRRPPKTPYSPRHLTKEVPTRINLGVLMDGITMRVLTDEFMGFVDELNLAGLTVAELLIVADLLGNIEVLPPSVPGRKFYRGVMIPVHQFIAYWDTNQLVNLIFEAMMSGKVRHLSDYLNSRQGNKGAWKRMFMGLAWAHMSHPKVL